MCTKTELQKITQTVVQSVLRLLENFCLKIGILLKIDGLFYHSIRILRMKGLYYMENQISNLAKCVRFSTLENFLISLV